MEVFNTMYAVDCVHCEWYTVEALLADNTGEAARMVGLARRPEDAVEDGVPTHAALLKGLQVISLTEGSALHCVEWPSL